MMAEAFSHPFMYWVGMNTAPNTDAAALAAFNTFYSKTHLPEVVASNPGVVRGWRYELLQPDPRGDLDPDGWRSMRWMEKLRRMPMRNATMVLRKGGPPTHRVRRLGRRVKVCGG